MKKVNLEKHMNRCLVEIDSQEFDDAAWVKMFISSLPRINNIFFSERTRKVVWSALFLSPNISIESIYNYRWIVMNHAWSGAMLGKNPMVPIWIETGDSQFSEISMIPIRHSLLDWIDLYFGENHRPKDFEKLIELLQQPQWMAMLSPVRDGYSLLEGYGATSFAEALKDEISLLFSTTTDATPEQYLELAKDGHRLLLALCKAFETPVPENIFSSLEEP